MSNTEDPYESEAIPKMKRVQRACDMCRRKKRRCALFLELESFPKLNSGDGGERCDHCTKHNFICTYVEPPTTRSSASPEVYDPPTSRGYVAALENRLKTLETLLEQAKTESPGLQLVMNAMRQLNTPLPAPDHDDLTFTDIDESFRFLSIDNDVRQGFQGKSSSALLVKTAIELRTNVSPGHDSTAYNISGPHTPRMKLEVSAPPPSIYTFPEDDLLASLTSLYFDNVNKFFPLLLRSNFESGVSQQFHLTHAGFAKTLLLICAIGACYSTDPRVATPGTTMAETAGLKWFDQVDLSGYAVYTRPTLYDLQSFCFAAEFLAITSSHRTCWMVVGFGLRVAQDLGAHRSKRRSGAVTLEQESERHAFWVLWLFDIQMSTALGRSTVLRPQDFDIEMPSTTIFTSSSKVIPFFNCMLDVTRILGGCGILYSTNHSRTFMGLGDDEWKKKVILELNSALNTWFNTIPDHLRWDANHLIQDDIFFDQSAALHCAYYYTRIMIHRPFILELRGASNSRHLLSLAICNTAARACSQVAEIHQQRRPNNALWFSQTPLFTSAIVLLLNIWGGAGNGVSGVPAAEKDLVDVHRCMAVLNTQRQTWPSAGHFLDTLRQLLALDRRPWPPRNAHANNEPQPFAPGVSYPGAQSERHFKEPLPVTLSPPIYDPQLENPPQHHPTGTPSYSPGLMNPTNGHVLRRRPVLSGEQQAHIAVAYPPLEAAFAALDRVYPHGEDFDMDRMEPRTIAPWPRSPPTFGNAANWDGYLSNFADDTRSNQPSPQY
ncbi:fungal-specific transcription factor domain-containing protein [Mycena epipterygia]|nr:fungal-specific transcription factor domain-containing protein [Mycena epipterygia]